MIQLVRMVPALWYVGVLTPGGGVLELSVSRDPEEWADSYRLVDGDVVRLELLALFVCTSRERASEFSLTDAATLVRRQNPAWTNLTRNWRSVFEKHFPQLYYPWRCAELEAEIQVLKTENEALRRLADPQDVNDDGEWGSGGLGCLLSPIPPSRSPGCRQSFPIAPANA